MAKRQRRGNRQGPAAAAGAAPRPGGGPPAGAAATGFGPVRDAVRRDIEQATQALAFAEQLFARLDGQRRLFIDFPRAMEELRSGSLERVAAALSRLYEGGPGVHDLSRFLRDLPLALAHLAAAESARRREGSAPPPPAGAAAGEAQSAFEATAATGSATDAPAAAGEATASALNSEAGAANGAAGATAAEGSAPAAQESAGASPPAVEAAAAPSPAAGPTPAPAGGPVSPRLELRAKLLAAAPQLGRAAQSYRRNVATVRRATAPRRAPGPWRSDREVLEQARRAVEFARQIFDAYAEAWADAPLPKGLHQMAAEETDRFLAWTQLVRYVELARAQPPGGGEAALAGSEGEGEPASPQAEAGGRVSPQETLAGEESNGSPAS